MDKQSFSVRVTKELYKKLCYVAQKELRTPSGTARYLIMEYIRHYEALFGWIEV